jgi:hypothetical protein
MWQCLPTAAHLRQRTGPAQNWTLARKLDAYWQAEATRIKRTNARADERKPQLHDRKRRLAALSSAQEELFHPHSRIRRSAGT